MSLYFYNNLCLSLLPLQSVFQFISCFLSAVGFMAHRVKEFEMGNKDFSVLWHFVEWVEAVAFALVSEDLKWVLEFISFLWLVFVALLLVMKEARPTL